MLKPVILCTKCNGRLHKCNTLTDDYIKSERFRSLAPNVWKYLYSMFSDSTFNLDTISLNEGGTPLRISKSGTKLFDLENLHIKDETRNPTGTFLDRGTTVEITSCKLMNTKNLLRCAIVGELAISLAAYSARAGFPCEVLIPLGEEWKLSPHRLYQIISYGAKINFILPSFTMSTDDYYLLRSSNTMFFEGLKTTGFEICDQLEWDLPDRIIVPIGNGTHLYAIYCAIKELVQRGLIKGDEKKKVKMHGVTVGNTLRKHGIVKTALDNTMNKNITITTTTTIAPELTPVTPSYIENALFAINSSEGSLVEVSDDDLINGVSLLASYEGIFASPAGASSLAGLLKLLDSNMINDHKENIVCIVTGSGGMDYNITDWKQLEAYNRMKQSQEEQLIKSCNRNNRDRGSKTPSAGSTKMKILLHLNKKSDYVYAIHNWILNSETKNIDISTLYQHLNELERMGFVRRVKAERYKGKPIRFYYSLTRLGKNLITTQ